MGRYYDEGTMGKVRADLERRVKEWPGVRAGQMFGCPCFDADGKLFAFVATGGVVLTRLDATDRERLAKEFGAGPFAPDPGRAASKWSLVPARAPEDLEPFLPWIRKSYEVARAAAKPAERRRVRRAPSKKRGRR